MKKNNIVAILIYPYTIYPQDIVNKWSDNNNPAK